MERSSRTNCRCYGISIPSQWDGVNTHICTNAHPHTHPHMNTHTRTAPWLLLWTDGHVVKHLHIASRFFFFFTLLLLHNFYYYPDALRETTPPSPHTHAHTYAYLHTLTYTQSSTVSSLPAAIIPLQDRQINYGLLDLETIMIAAWPPQWSLKVSWLPLPASLKRHVSGWHY